MACPLWRSLTRRDSLDAFAWYGSAYCLTSDDVVIPNESSPSGWSFRTSYSQALRDYETAFRLHPPMLASFGGGAFDALGRLFKTGASLLRQGRAAPPNARRFSSSMEWSHDSLAFVPYPWGGDHSDHLIRRVDALAEAVRHQRALVRDVASTWVASFPDNPDAWVALALSLAALGESAALDTVAHARAIARTDRERMRADGVNVAMQVAYAVRDGDTLRLRRAKALADSLLDRGSSNDADAVLLTSLAALTGRAAIAARYSRARSVAEAFTVPDALRDGTATLLVLSALGGPADSLAVIERRVSDLITRGISPAERLGRRLEFLARAASMAFPRYRFESLDSLASDGDALIVLESRSVRGDSAGVRRGLAAFKAARRAALPEHLALDALTPEAALLSSLGTVTDVIAWLAPTLRSLPQMQPGLLSSPVRAGSLPHALLLHARAEATIGDRAAAQRSAAAVAILWSNADAFLQPLVEEARRLAR
jgi:hypothetical protein